MESLFEQLLHWLRLAVEAAAAFRIGMRVAARTHTVLPADAHPAQA